MTTPVRLLALAGVLAAALASPAAASPLLLLNGDDTSVTVLDMGSRIRTGDAREASLYHGEIAQAGKPRVITGERHLFDCPGRREKLVATLTRRPGDSPLRTPVEAEWRAVAWNTPMDFAAAAVCLNIYNRDRVSTKDDVPSILASLEQVWQPGYPQPPPGPAPEPPRRKRSLLRPF